MMMQGQESFATREPVVAVVEPTASGPTGAIYELSAMLEIRR